MQHPRARRALEQEPHVQARRSGRAPAWVPSAISRASEALLSSHSETSTLPVCATTSGTTKSGRRGTPRRSLLLSLAPRARSRAPPRPAPAARRPAGLMSMPGTRPPKLRASRAIWRRSLLSASPAPGYCTLTATSRPSLPPCRGAPGRWRRRRPGWRRTRPGACATGAELAGQDLVHGDRRHRRRGVLQPGELLAVGRRDLLGQRRLEDRDRLAHLHRPALEVAERAEQLLGGALLHLGEHRVGRGAAEPPAHAQRGAAGEAEGQGGEPRRAGDGLAG